MQINIGKGHVYIGDETMKTWSGKDLISDRKKCFQVGLETLRLSIDKCKGFEKGDRLSAYTSGKCIRGERKAIVRWNFAKQLMSRFLTKK
jgi:hypothetical protein